MLLFDYSDQTLKYTHISIFFFMLNIITKSLNRKLVFLFVAMSAIPLTAVSLYGNNFANDTIDSQVERQLVSEAIGRGNSVQTLLDLRAEQTVLFSHQPALSEKLLGTGSQSALEAEVNDYLQSVGNGKGILSLDIIDEKGITVYSLDKTREQTSQVFDSDFKRGLNEAFTTLKFDNQKRTVSSFVPITSSDGKSIGVLRVDYVPVRLDSILLNRDGLGESGETYLIDNNKLMLTPSRFIEGLEFKQVVDTEPVKKCIAGNEPMTGIYPDYRGVPIFGTSRCFPELGMTLLAEIDVAEREAPTIALQNVIITSIAISAAVVGIMAFMIAKRISKPISNASKIAKTISEGNLNVHIEKSKSTDEVGTLINSIHAMTSNLKSVLTQVRDASHSVASGSVQLSASGNQLDTASQQIATTVDQIAKGSQEQAGDLEMSKKIVEDLNSEFDDLTNVVSNSVLISKKIDELSVNSKNAAKEAGDKMVQMVEATTVTSNTVKKLVAQTQEITNVVDTIKGISEQINLLALNAAIEAARAGESGRGFAVVADEVRRLAENSSKSTKEIAEKLNQIRTDGGIAVEAIETNAKTINEGQKVISMSISALDDIATNIKEITSNIEELSEKTSSQATRMKQVLEKSGNVASVAEQSAAATEQMSAAVEEQTAQISEINNSARDLTSLAEQLTNSLSKFRFDAADSSDVEVDENQNVLIPTIPVAKIANKMKEKIIKINSR